MAYSHFENKATDSSVTNPKRWITSRIFDNVKEADEKLGNPSPTVYLAGCLDSWSPLSNSPISQECKEQFIKL